jgi:uncharacterized membrane protein YhaH (DUF805 family)
MIRSWAGKTSTSNGGETVMREDLYPSRLWSLTGRRGRVSFLLSSALVWLAVTLLVVLAYPLLVSGGAASFTAFKVLRGVALTLAFWTGIAVTVQRLHDLDLAGWWVALPLLLLGLIDALSANLSTTALILAAAQLAGTVWLAMAPGNPAANRFGEPPAWPEDVVVLVSTVTRRATSRAAV